MAHSWYPEASQTLMKVIEMVGKNRVVDVKPCSWLCEEMYPCQGHDGVILTYENGEKLTINDGVSSVGIGAIESFFLPHHRKSDYKGDKHFVEYIDDKYASELKNLWDKHYTLRLVDNQLDGEVRDSNK
jgi:hypothetical protein